MAISPMMQHYLKTKEQNKDAILFYRLGDFYEMFFEDAKICASELDLVLTGKDCGMEKRAPMCGIPYHAMENYLGKLIEKGYKVAVCEQTSSPADGPGLVKREVVRTITPGTVTETSVLDEKKNNYIAAIYLLKNTIGVCVADITTGLLEMTEFTGESMYENLDDLLVRVKPSEILCNDAMYLESPRLASVKLGLVPRFYPYFEWAFEYARAEKTIKNQFKINSLKVFDIENKKHGISAIGALLVYIEETQKRQLSNINKITALKDDFYMQLDANTRRNLEITENMNTRKKRGSLIWLLDNTKTPMGARKLRQFIEQPLQDETEINRRLDGVEELFKKRIVCDNTAEILNRINDIERISGKISYGTISPRECLSLLNSLKFIPELKLAISGCLSDILVSCRNDLVDLSDLCGVITNAIAEDAPALVSAGGYIKTGYNAELDEIRNAGTLGKQWLAKLEQQEKEETGIKNLKIGFNKVFGYYIEVTNSALSLVPYRYQRKQTTTGGERFITPELKEMEEKILGSEEKALKLEAKLYSEIKTYLLDFVVKIQKIANAVSVIDSLYSFAIAATKHNYVKPEISSKINIIEITDGRHPVVEALLATGEFVSNDTLLDNKENRTMIITGPNMAGKSTFMRQVAVITLMAHIGCFVPATSAKLSITDRIFTRVGASDDLAFGQSTFMVEMTEVANILRNATSKSLIILDEIGRGTSTYDGLSIAWAVMEYLSKTLTAKTLFATHYHELTELEGKLDGVKNYRVLVKEFEGSIIFLHKIARGSANKSFGIEVAELAGLPKELINRAKEILKTQEEADIIARNSGKKTSINQTKGENENNTQNFNTAEVIGVLKDLNMETISPLIAFGTLQNLVDKVKK